MCEINRCGGLIIVMLTAGDLRKGITFEYDGQVYIVIDFLHVKPGKGAAFVRTKLRNVIAGGLLLRGKRWSIYTMMNHYIILWIWKHMNKFHLIMKK